MTAKTTTERVAALRARRLLEGLQEVRGIFLPLAQHAKLKEMARKMKKESNRGAM
jgi:hypothetical protein